jgi:thymidylate synthase (FAD)
MSATLISYTKSENPEMKTLTDIIVFVARVSNPQSQMRFLKPDKLIEYLIKHKHWSPFEMTDVCVEVNTTLDIATQILRHRSFSFQQFSMRYANSELAFGEDTEEIRETRLTHPTNRQSSVETDDNELTSEWEKRQKEVYELSRKHYNWALEKGIAKEVSRGVLTQSSKTRLYMKGSIRSFIHYVQLRTSPDTQREHRVIALKISKAIQPVFPQIESFTNTEGIDSDTKYLEEALTTC